MSTRKLLSQIRKLLSSSDWPTIQQGIVLASGMGMPELNTVPIALFSGWYEDSIRPP